MSDTATVTDIRPEPVMRVRHGIEVHDTDPELYAALAAAFGDHAGSGSHRWVAITQSGHTINFHVGVSA